MVLETSFLVALVIGLTEVAKRFGLQNRWLPVLAVLLGVGFNLVFRFLGVEWYELLTSGIVIGLAGSGLWDLGKLSVLGKN